MKDVQMKVRAGTGETYTIRGRGTLQQTPRDIVGRTVEQFREFLARDGSGRRSPSSVMNLSVDRIPTVPTGPRM